MRSRKNRWINIFKIFFFLQDLLSFYLFQNHHKYLYATNGWLLRENKNATHLNSNQKIVTSGELERLVYYILCLSKYDTC
jgi:hypothetical protein